MLLLLLLLFTDLNNVVRSVVQRQGQTRFIFLQSVHSQKNICTFLAIWVFVFSPTPDISWERLDGNLSDKHFLTNFGQKFWIPNYQESDVGSYRCLGSNSESVQTQVADTESSIRSMFYFCKINRGKFT